MEELLPVIQAADPENNQTINSDASSSSSSLTFDQITDIAQKPLTVLGEHFKCNLCFTNLDECAIFSSECMHRFCPGCITTFLRDSKTKNLCPCCPVQNPTEFLEDRSFGIVAKAIHNLASLVSLNYNNVHNDNTSPAHLICDADGWCDAENDHLMEHDVEMTQTPYVPVAVRVGNNYGSEAEAEADCRIENDMKMNQTRELNVEVKVGHSFFAGMIALCHTSGMRDEDGNDDNDGNDGSPHINEEEISCAKMISQENDDDESMTRIRGQQPVTDESPSIPCASCKGIEESLPITAPVVDRDDTKQMRRIKVVVKLRNKYAKRFTIAVIPSSTKLSGKDSLLGQQSESEDVVPKHLIPSIRISAKEYIVLDQSDIPEDAVQLDQSDATEDLTSDHQAISVSADKKSEEVKIVQKYARGSCFIIKETQKYGRIVGYDSSQGLYQIFYPQDKKCDFFAEAAFDKVQFIKQHKRPSTVRGKVIGRKIHAKDDQAPRCLVCQKFFSSNPELSIGSGKTPIQSNKCSHVICFDCVQARRIDHAGISGAGMSITNLRSTVDCPFCDKKQAFNAMDPTVCLSMCQMVTMYKRMRGMQKREDYSKRINQQDRQMRRKKERARRQKRKERKERERIENMKRQKRGLEEEKVDPNEHGVKPGSTITGPVRENMNYPADNSEPRPKRSKSGLVRERRVKIKGDGKERTSSCRSTSSKSSSKCKRLTCATCKRKKEVEKFPSKQIQRRKQGKENIYCRRCEEKGVIQKKLGRGYDKVSTALSVSKEHESKAKFLTTLVPWKHGKALKESPLPSDLTLDGYTRESWGLLGNNDFEQESMWTKGYLWSTSGEKVANFLQFLRVHEKSAFGTFLLPDGTDGFFVVPYDQTPLSKKENIFQSKYILGLGLVGEKLAKDDGNQQPNTPSVGIEPDVEESGGNDSANTLRNLLAAEAKNRDSLAMVPKGSVKVVKKILVPEAPKAQYNGGGSDWHRERIIIIQDGESDDDNDECEGINDSAEGVEPDFTRSSGVNASTCTTPPDLKNTKVEL